MKQVDILVIGLGPGGASAARKAAEAGKTVLAVEKNKVIGEPVQCAEFIPNPMGSYAQADNVLLQRIVGMKSFLPSGEHLDSDFPGMMVDRAEFDRDIARIAQEAGAELWSGSKLLGLNAAEHVATVKHQDEEQSIAYKVLIAADGPHSPSAKYLGLPSLKTVNTRQYTVPLLKAYEDTDIWLSDAYPGGYAWLFPKGAWANLGLGADKRFETDLKQPLDDLHQQLMEQGLLGKEITYHTGGAIPVGGLRENLYQDDVLFVGDAAGLTHPITGAGIAAAVVSGEIAGDAAVAHLDGDDDAFADFEEDVRDQYESAVSRAVERREELEAIWRTQAAQEDESMKRGWIAFDQYFKS